MFDTSRHDAVLPSVHRDTPVHVIGVGATGSRVFASLVELGMKNISIYDDDVVEDHNLANQIYLDHDVNTLKVEACRCFANEKLGDLAEAEERLSIYNYRVDSTSDIDFDGIVFLMVDTMSARREIFDCQLDSNSSVTRVIETRMASNYGDIYMIDPMSQIQVSEWYDTLSDDEPTDTTACGSSITVGSTASIIANMAIWNMIRHLCTPYPSGSKTKIFLSPLMVSHKTIGDF